MTPQNPTADGSTTEHPPVSADAVSTDARVVLTDGGEDGSGSDSTENGEDEKGTSLLYLDLSGLFVDLLGVEIELNRVELDLSAVPGPGNLLGNLLSQVVGLLDDVAGTLGGLVPEGGIDTGNLLPEVEIPSSSDVFFGAINLVLDALLDALGDDEATKDDDGTDGNENDAADSEDGEDGEGNEDGEDDTEDD